MKGLIKPVQWSRNEVQSAVALEDATAPTATTGFDFDDSLQARLLNLLMRDYQFASRTDGLVKPEYFTDESNQALARLANDHFATYREPIGFGSTFVHQLKKAYADKKIPTPVVEEIKRRLLAGNYKIAVENREFLLDTAINFAKNRAVENAIIQSAELVGKGDYGKIEKLMKEALLVGDNRSAQVYDYFKEIDARTQYRKDVLAGTIKPNGISTGCPDFDKYLFHKGWGRKDSCVAPNTILLSEDGMVEIGDYVPPALPAGSYADCKKAILGRNGMEAADQAYRNGPAKTLRVTTKAQFSVEGTYNHPVLVMLSDGKLAWRHLSEVRLGDQMVVQRGMMVFGSHVDLTYAVEAANARIAVSTRSACMTKVEFPRFMTPDLAEFLGMIVAEGYFGERSGEVVFTQKCPDVTERYVDLARSLFGLELKPSSRSNAFVVQFGNVALQAYFEALGLSWTRSAGQTMPRAVRVAPEACVKAFLRALLGLEGSVHKGGPDKTVFDLSMASREMIRHMARQSG